MAEMRFREERYELIGRDLIATEPELEYIRNSDVQIAFLASDNPKKSKGKLVFGECEKVPPKYRWCIREDFTITVFEPNVEHFTEEQYKMLIFHELLHIGIELGEDKETYSIRPHDLEDFRIIIDRFGTNWGGDVPEGQTA